MHIQSISNIAQAPQLASTANDGHISNSMPSAAATATGASIELPTIAPQQVAEQQPAAAQLKSAVDNINQLLKQSNTGIEFSVDASTNKPLVKVVDSSTGDVIRQFPSEEALALTRAIDRIQQGLLLKQQA